MLVLASALGDADVSEGRLSVYGEEEEGGGTELTCE